MNDAFLIGAYVFLLAVFLGVELIGRVPSTLHTPLMSATNAIHGIVMLGGMILMGVVDNLALSIVGFIAVACGAANIVGGFVVTDRMLGMFKQRPVADTSGEAGSPQ
ncbi:MAG: NAD(P) transhydrogenase subunit alpha [Thermomicrobiales bacterium]